MVDELSRRLLAYMTDILRFQHQDVALSRGRGTRDLPSALPPICMHLQKVILDSELLMSSFDASSISDSVCFKARRASNSSGYEATADSVWTIRRLNLPRIVSPIADIYLGFRHCRTCLKSDK